MSRVSLRQPASKQPLLRALIARPHARNDADERCRDGSRLEGAELGQDELC